MMGVNEIFTILLQFAYTLGLVAIWPPSVEWWHLELRFQPKAPQMETETVVAFALMCLALLGLAALSLIV